MARSANGARYSGRDGGGGSFKERFARFLLLLAPGIGLKRWALLGSIGVSICAIGMAYWVRRLGGIYFRDFLPWYLEGVLLVSVGGFCILAAMYGFHRTLSPLVFRDRSIGALTDALHSRRSAGKGPRIVAIGGGTGLSTLLRGLKSRTDNLTAIVTVADDGGSSGRLRRELAILPPGDLRNCILAMADDESLLAELFQYRFDKDGDLQGHSFGNLFIAAMTDVTGSFDRALVETSRALAVRGRAIPVTSANARLSAHLEDGRMVHGESSLRSSGGRVKRLVISPANARANPLAVRAISEADMIVMGPGSLYTSVISNLLVPGIAEAIEESSAVKVYVCNIATERGETDGYTVAEHVAALRRHTSERIADYALANSAPAALDDRFESDETVTHDGAALDGAKILMRDLVDESHPTRHDSDKLADAAMEILDMDAPAHEILEPPVVGGAVNGAVNGASRNGTAAGAGAAAAKNIESSRERNAK